MTEIQPPATFVLCESSSVELREEKAWMSLSFVFPNLLRQRTRGNVFDNRNRFFELFHIQEVKLKPKSCT